ncbi:hypothetical protein SC1_02902 [Sphingopyxis sp. C-1]|nr:hypothetical protein SC1_02902 [Sphingopyxis sp. C-1]
MAAGPEVRLGRHPGASGCCRHRPSPCATGNKKAARTAATRAHPDGFIACWSAGKGSLPAARTGPSVGTVAALSRPGILAECVKTA